MMLLTQDIKKKLPVFYHYDNNKIETKEIIAQVKYFTTWNDWRWYGVEFDPETKLFYGWVDGDFPEWGYFSLDELSQVRGGPLNLSIERDLFFTPKSMKDIENFS